MVQRLTATMPRVIATILNGTIAAGTVLLLHPRDMMKLSTPAHLHTGSGTNLRHQVAQMPERSWFIGEAPSRGKPRQLQAVSFNRISNRRVIYAWSAVRESRAQSGPAALNVSSRLWNWLFPLESFAHVEQTKTDHRFGACRHSPRGFRNFARRGERNQERRFRAVVLLAGRMAIHQCRSSPAHSR